MGAYYVHLSSKTYSDVTCVCVRESDSFISNKISHSFELHSRRVLFLPILKLGSNWRKIKLQEVSIRSSAFPELHRHCMTMLMLFFVFIIVVVAAAAAFHFLPHSNVKCECVRSHPIRWWFKVQCCSRLFFTLSILFRLEFVFLVSVLFHQ